MVDKNKPITVMDLEQDAATDQQEEQNSRIDRHGRENSVTDIVEVVDSLP
jgi:hypothetical protein